MPLPRKRSLDQMVKLYRNLKKQGYNTDKTSPSEKGLPNSLWNHDPFASHISGKRKVSTYEDFCKDDKALKTAKSLQKTNESKKMILSLHFKNNNDFEKAKKFFDTKSVFSPDIINDEFRTFDFDISDQEEADNLEKEIMQELEENQLGRSYFTSESNETEKFNLDDIQNKNINNEYMNTNEAKKDKEEKSEIKTDTITPQEIMRDMKNIMNWQEFTKLPNPRKERSINIAGKYIETSKVRGYINRVENNKVFIESIDKPTEIIEISLKDAIKGIKNKK